MTGALQCFWNSLYKDNGFDGAFNAYMMHDEVKIKGESKKVYLWREYALERSINQYGGYVVSGVTVGINFIIRLAIVFLIKRIGIETVTNQTKLVTIYIFVLQFFNTAFLNLLTYANLREAIKIPFPNGAYSDFTYNWYIDFGIPLAGSMIFNSYFPIIEFFIFYALRVLMRIYDRKFRCCNRNITRK